MCGLPVSGDTGCGSSNMSKVEKKLDEFALRDFKLLRRRSDIAAVIRIDEGIKIVCFGRRIG